MTISPEFVEQRMEAFKAACQARGLKVTHQRLEIYRALAATGEHPDAETLWREVRRRIPTISRDTVYRNLKMLAGQGLVAIVGMSHERLRFDAHMAHHHHFVCVCCGLIRDFNAPEWAGVETPAEAAAFGEPISLHLEVKGICCACRAKE